MAWDTEGTKARLLDAAAAEFSERGLAGGRVDRIAEAAGVNKERIYSYFGNKEKLFGAVLRDQLARVMDAVPITGEGPEAIVDYAGRVLDYQCEHPELARLMMWEGLELGVAIDHEARAERTASKIAAIRHAVPALTQEQAAELLLTITTLADGFQALPQLDRLYTGSTRRDAARIARRREALTSTVRAALQAFD
ncbi:TetR/AcrR family transcriptional regulator [Homoserinibacter sp. GY 40078]|uniref:TetR/AcrR family transcriptional regulator n=1 Tax=Homoserinibacter sp. GY 40078 TaxID=2603275 RepID=UPI0011CC8178|nr:TetR family transcriptional regulator [Homoserinibacter sp. GY 40078]TXK18397.1 TetR/AcrR family transcriptional regulator [Homoserinibacter sp. GY 40078]